MNYQVFQMLKWTNLQQRVIFSDFNIIVIFSTYFPKINLKNHENPQSGCGVDPKGWPDGQTDGQRGIQTGASKSRFTQFCRRDSKQNNNSLFLRCKPVSLGEWFQRFQKTIFCSSSGLRSPRRTEARNDTKLLTFRQDVTRQKTRIFNNIAART